VGGNLELQRIYDCPIYGYQPDHKRIPGLTHGLTEGELFQVGKSQWQTLFVPGHTLGHIAFYCSAENILFCGDTLFSLGCGRLFEGSPFQMWQSLQKIMRLPKETLIYCAHEYTLKNAEFALNFEPSNPELQQYLKLIKKLRSQDQPTIPTNLGRELSCNPFLRPDSLEIRTTLNSPDSDPAEIFAKLRAQKDAF
jgi:hydroxyacylglutathione hydrolase